MATAILTQASVYSGVYEIVNVVNGKRYIGSARHLRKRWYQHRWRLDRGTHPNPHMQSAWSKYGAAAFQCRPLLICSLENLLVYEQRAIDTYRPEYNICHTAGSMLGCKATDETKKKISAALIGNAYAKGKKWRVTNRRAAQAERPPISDETRERMRAGWAVRRANVPVSDEARANMSAAAMGNTNGLGHFPSAETRKKLSAAQLKRDPTTRNGNKGVPKSAEHNEKNRAAQIKRFALKRAASLAEYVI